MKLNMVWAFLALGASTALAAAPNMVAGTWKLQPKTGFAGGFDSLMFTKDGKLLNVSIPNRRELLGDYRRDNDKVIARGRSGETYAFELMKDGRLCVFPGPAMIPVDGSAKGSSGERQCYQRMPDPA